MNLRNLDIKNFYDSDTDNILHSFYIPALSASTKYQRLAGFFCSSSLAVAARGIAGLISNKGKMQLICSAILKKDDVEAIVKANKDPIDMIRECALRDLEDIKSLQNEFISDHVRALGWMVANKLLEIKIAIIRENNRPLDYIEVEQSGIFHQKVGILYDNEGNIISFSGSNNESARAWRSNIEEFKVFCSWEESHKMYLKADCDRFLKFWEGLAKRVDTIDVPKAVRQKLIEIAPDDIEIIKTKLGRVRKKEIKLWEHQLEAINRWLENDKKCLFEMATGTGKTFAALGCLKRLLAGEKKLATIIACPYNHMIMQWKDDLDEFGIDTGVVIADSSNSDWKNQLIDYIRDINNDVRKSLVVFTTHDTFHTQDFIDILEMFKGKLFLVGDEVHGMWSRERKKGFREYYQFRLGLSATPSRWFDPAGTNELFKYFNIKDENDKYSFPLSKAIRTINPDTGQTYLVPYKYRPYFVELTQEEFERYERETKKIKKLYHSSRNKEERDRNYELLCIKRQEIIKNAVNKYNVFRHILDDLGDIQHCLIYCSPEQIDAVQAILTERYIIQHKFTQNESTHPEKKYGGISEREHLLKKFAEGSYKALVAMRCLDEGVDIPQARIGIILASTENPRQYIQRRGRILRRYPGKEEATILDLVVLPPAEAETIDGLEKKILGKEFERYEEFARDAKNFVECIKRLEEVENRFK